jgi:hypothetical protein
LNDKSETIKIENQSPKSNNDTSTRSCSCWTLRQFTVRKDTNISFTFTSTMFFSALLFL